MTDVNINTLLSALAEEGIEIESSEFTRAVRRATNPAGCEHCGARTKVGVNVKNGDFALACCGHVVTAAKKGK